MLFEVRFKPGREPTTILFNPLADRCSTRRHFRSGWMEKNSLVGGGGQRRAERRGVEATTKPEFRGVKFGDGRVVGVRHLRIGFTESIAVGSVLVRGGGVLSVLKADAAYPGNVAVDRSRAFGG